MLNKKKVILIMYDLPVKKAVERKSADSFRKFLIRFGYINVQKSIYAKLIRSRITVSQEISLIKSKMPKAGVINVLALSLNEFQTMQTLLGENFDMKLFSDDLVLM